MRRTRLTVAVVATSAVALVGASATSAQAASAKKAPRVITLTDRVLAPFNVAVRGGSVYVADGFAGRVSRIRANGSLATVASASGPMADVAGLAFSPTGSTIAWTSTNFQTGEATLTLSRSNFTTRHVSLSDYEKRVNPDGKVRYGISNPTQCQIDAFKDPEGPPARYKGIVDSHPYSVESWNNHWIVADAGGNDLLKVDRHGHISTLAVLPPQPTKITAGMARAAGLPSCVVGATYAFEPVPTDVEVGRHGMLYVTTLPGGPEDPSGGARGSVYRVDPYTGQATRVATGFAGATNLAIGANGTVFVSELFAGRISTVHKGKPRTYVALPNALSVEYAQGRLYAGTMAPMDDQGNPTGKGRVVQIRR